jgi:probable phosphomutase (TIGR03848 family)
VALLLLIRHGQAETTGKRLSGQAPGIHLSERGREQSEHLVERLRPIRLAAVYASTLERCTETAAPIAAHRGLEVRTVPELVDIHYGDWTGRSLKQVARSARWRAELSSPSTGRFPGGESFVEVQARAVAALERIAAAHRRGAVAVFTHADPIRLVLAHYGGSHLDAFERLIVHPASVSAVLAGPGGPRILRVNDTGTLADLAPPARPRRPRTKVGG